MRQPRTDLDCCIIKKTDANTRMLFADYSPDTLKANPVTLLVSYITYNACLSRNNACARFLHFLPERHGYFLKYLFPLSKL